MTYRAHRAMIGSTVSQLRASHAPDLADAWWTWYTERNLFGRLLNVHLVEFAHEQEPGDYELIKSLAEATHPQDWDQAERMFLSANYGDL